MEMSAVKEVLEAAFDKLGVKPKIEDTEVGITIDGWTTVIPVSWKEKKARSKKDKTVNGWSVCFCPEVADHPELAKYSDIRETIMKAVNQWALMRINPDDLIMTYAMGDLHKQELQEVLHLIRERCLSAKLSETGMVYFNALEKAALQYGERGLQTQVDYMLTNGRWSSKEDRKALERYARKGDISALIGE